MRFCYAERSEAFQSEGQSEPEKQLETKFLASDLLLSASCLHETSPALVFYSLSHKIYRDFQKFAFKLPFQGESSCFIIGSGRCPELN